MNPQEKASELFQNRNDDSQKQSLEIIQQYIDDSRTSWQNLSLKQQLEREKSRAGQRATEYQSKRKQAIERATWTCLHCGTVLVPSIVRDQYTGRQIISRQKRCACPQAIAEFEETLKAERAEINQRHLDWLITSPGWIGFDTTWPNSPQAREQLKVAKQLVYDAYVDERDGILLSGPVGSGKSHLARTFYRAYGTQGKRVSFYTEPEIVSALRSKGSEDNAITRACEIADVLIFDDIGAEEFNGQSEWVHNLLKSFYFRIFERRQAGDKKTFITTNLKSAAMKEHTGERATSRIMHIIEASRNIAQLWDVPDYRAKGFTKST